MSQRSSTTPDLHTCVLNLSHGFSLSSQVWVLLLAFLPPLARGAEVSPERAAQFDTKESI